MIVYKPLSQIKAISFDLDDTLYDNMPYIYAAEQALNDYVSKHYPLVSSITEKQWRAFRKEALQEQADLVNDIGALRSIVLTKGFVKAGVQSDLIPFAVTDCFDFFYAQRSAFTVNKKIRKTLKKLAKKVPLAAITNGNVNCEAIGISRYFESIMHASPNNPMKPDPAMFLKTAERLNIKPENILHVGDDLHKDVWAACQVGYQTAWYAVNRPMEIQKERVSMLPNIQLSSFKQLKKLV